MIGAVVVLAASAVAIDVGWQPLDDGGYEYVIQIEPELLDTMRAGHELFSELPPFPGLRRYRIVVGDEPLPNAGIAPGVGAESPDAAARAAARPTGESDTPEAADATAGGAGKTLDDDPLEGPALTGTPPGNPDGIAKPATTAAGDRDEPAPAPSPGAEQSAARDTPGRHTAGYVATAGAPEADGDAGPSGATPSDDSPSDALATAGVAGAGEDERPWPMLIGAALALFASLGANVYLFWNTISLRSRCRSLVAQLHGG